MCQGNNTTELLKNKHLTERQRYTIEDLLKEVRDAEYIANRLGKGLRTIEREIKRGTVTLRNTNLRDYKMYCADAGQRVYAENSKNKGPMLKVGKDH
jgi:IS30 family transposase